MTLNAKMFTLNADKNLIYGNHEYSFMETMSDATSSFDSSQIAESDKRCNSNSNENSEIHANLIAKQTHFTDSSEAKKPKRFTLNARGVKYDVISNVFDKLPLSRLGKLKCLIDKMNEGKSEENANEILKFCDDYDLEKSEFYFNKDPSVLNIVLNFYASDRLHMDDNMCANHYGEELLYWEIDENFVEFCCQFKYFEKKEEIIKQIKIENKERNDLVTHRRASFSEMEKQQLLYSIKKNIFYLLEKPKSS